jgi:hypothetical protein
MSDELREEYRFDYSKAKPNRFAEKLEKAKLRRYVQFLWTIGILLE